MNTLDLFITLLLAHIIGDFYLQPASLAVRKGSNNLVCAAHCLIYTLIIALFTNFDPIWLSFIFFSHFLIDRFSLADLHLKLIKGRSLEHFLKEGHLNIPIQLPVSCSDETGDRIVSERMNYRILRGAFSAVVYLIIDFSYHIFSMFYFYRWYFSL